MGVNGEKGAVKEHVVAPRDADGGEVFHLQVADLVGLVLDVDPAELRLRKFFREGEEPRAIFGAGIAPRGAKAAHHDHA